MKETMDGAAKSRLEKVAQHILPHRPHHLSLSLGRRYPKPDGFWYTGTSSPLQYLTFVSQADRGILLTRPFYDICEEPETAAPPMPTKVLAKGEIKKLSIKDYQKKKNSSASPTDNDPAVKTEAKAETKLNGTAAHAKTAKEEVKKDITKPTERPEARQETQRQEKPRPELHSERNKVSQQRPQPPDPDSRKRNADADNDLPPQKRVKSESMMLKSEAARSSRPETPRARDRPLEKPRRNSRDDPPYSKTNGLAPPAMDRDRENTASPRSTIQVNGTRPHSDSGRSTPRKPEVSKASLPALLSPLHPSLVEQLDEQLETDRKRTGDKAPTKPQKTSGPPASKKPKSTIKIPALLSPTLPPIVEAELARLKKTPPKSDLSQRGTNTPESPSSARKTKPQPEEENGRSFEPSRIVTLKLKKTTAKRAKELLSLPSKSVKDALRKERSMSVEGTPPPARKRPRLLDDAPADNSLAKRNKTTGDTVVARPAGPSTPLKQSTTAMSRVTSNQSHGTPGNSTGLTPGTLDRPPTRSDSVEPARARPVGHLAAEKTFREKHAEYSGLGGKLKRQRDEIIRAASVTAAEDRRAHALTFEMVLAYMVAFHALDQVRSLNSKARDSSTWESLLPHLAELKRRVHGIRALRALALQMHAICLEQITAAFQTLNPTAAASCFEKWARLERNRVPLWGEADSAYEGVEDRRMRMRMGSATKVEDAVTASLNILRRWAEREDVRWSPVIVRDRDREGERVNGTRD